MYPLLIETIVPGGDVSFLSVYISPNQMNKSSTSWPLLNMLTMIYCLIAAKQNYEKQKKFYIFILFGESEVLIQTFDVKIHLPQNKYHLHCDLGVKYIPTCQESYKKKITLLFTHA